LEALSRKECSVCNDTGWAELVVEGVQRVSRCECRRSKFKKRILEQARIPGRYRGCDLESYENHDPTQRSAKGTAEQFVKVYPEVDAGLFFIGSCGVGKTHLSVAIIQALINTKGIPCIFFDFWDLLKTIQQTYDSNSEISESEVLIPVLNKEVVLLDDLGSHKVTDWRRDMLTYIINKRYNEKKITIITSNFIPSDKAGKRSNSEEDTLEERIGERLVSRLYEMCRVIEIKGKDYRRQIRQAAHRSTLR